MEEAKENLKECIVSVPVSLSPFCQCSDGTRLGMASNQMRQALDIEKCEAPLVQTGLEEYYENHSDLKLIAQSDYVILAITPDFLVVKLDYKEFGITDIKVIPIGRHNYEIFCIVGQHCKRGDILGRVKNRNGKGYKSILNGCNLLTAINSYYGFNYEDAIVVSESCAKKLAHHERVVETITFNARQVLLSLKEDSYEPLLKPGEVVKEGQVIALIKNSDLNNINELISPPVEKLSPCDGIIERVDVYINHYHDSTRELALYLNEILDINMMNLNTLLANICSVYNANCKPEDKLNSIDDLPRHIVNEISHLSGFNKQQKWKYKNVEVDCLVRYTIKKKAEFNIGDKIACRHGNKGTIPLIVPDEEMYQIDGRPVDIIINIMGLVGRMNMQAHVSEFACSNIVKKVKAICEMLMKKGKEVEALEVIKDFYNRMDTTDTKYILNSIDFTKPVRTLIDELHFVAPPFDSIDIYKLDELRKRYKVADIYEVYDPHYGGKIKMPVGYMFWEKLHHLSAEKIAARSLGGYNKKSMQPLSGKKVKGGQKFGEMEVWALIAHDADDLLTETVGLRSDDIQAKQSVLRNLITMGKAHLMESSNKSSEAFMIYLKALGLNIVDETIDVEDEDDIIVTDINGKTLTTKEEKTLETNE
jgi:DNA-directed RNA polymerase beta subunit